MCHPSTKTMKPAADSASPPPSYSAKAESESSAVEDVEKTEETTEEGPQMDSGWSWVVLAGAFMVHFTTMGFVASLGIFFNTWMEYFEASAASTSWVISIGSLLRGVLSKNDFISYSFSYIISTQIAPQLTLKQLFSI